MTASWDPPGDLSSDLRYEYCLRILATYYFATYLTSDQLGRCKAAIRSDEQLQNAVLSVFSLTNDPTKAGYYLTDLLGIAVKELDREQSEYA